MQGTASGRFSFWTHPSAAGIHQQICEINTLTAMSASKVRKWNKNFKAGGDSFGWEILSHSPYSSDLTPSDFYLFCYLKHYLGANYCNSNEVLKTAVKTWSSDQAVNFLEGDIQNPIVMYNTYLNKHGSYDGK